MRIDKFLKVSRIIKRRTLANEACDREKVMLNGRVAKAGAEVKEGDIVEMRFRREGHEVPHPEGGGAHAQGRNSRHV